MAKKHAKPADQAGKKKHQREPMTRLERRAKGMGKGAEAAQKAVPVKEPTGLTLAQLEAMNPRKPAGPSVAEIFQNDFLEALAAALEQKFGIKGVFSDQPQEVIPEEERHSEQTSRNDEFGEEIVPQVALRKVVQDEISRLLETTQTLFDGLHDFPEMAETMAGVLYEEGHPLDLELAKILISENPVVAIADFLEEIGSNIYELQLVAGALKPEDELKHSVDFGLIESDLANRLTQAAEKEVEQIGLRLRLEELAIFEGEIDETLARIINEGIQAAEDQRRERATFRHKLTHGLRERKQLEGRRFSKSSHESGDEEFIRFLLDHRGDLEAVRQNLPPALREQVLILLKDEKRKNPILCQLADLKAAAELQWTAIKSRFLAGASQPEETVTSNLQAIRVLQAQFAEIKKLNAKLEKLDEPEAPEKPNYGSRTWARTKNCSQPFLPVAEAFKRFRVANARN